MSDSGKENEDNIDGSGKKRERLTFADKVETTLKPGVSNPKPVKESSHSHKVTIANGNSTPSCSPPNKKFTSMKNFMEANDAATRLMLAHEINFDQKFKLPEPNYGGEDIDPATMSSQEKIESAVKSALHQAFWDKLSGDLNSVPPNYEHAFVLLGEIKKILLSLLPADRVTSLHRRINEGLDIELLKQQADHGALDITKLTAFIVDTMAAACAPARDEEVAKLRSIEDIVQLFRQMYKVLELMQRDFVNFSISAIRPVIQQHHVEYERKKFSEILSKLPTGLTTTEKWLRSCYEDLRDDMELRSNQVQSLGPSSNSTLPSNKISPMTVLKKAFLLLLHWDEGKPFPETVLVDQVRFKQLQLELKQIILTASALLTTFSSLKADLASQQGFVKAIKEEIFVLLKPVLIEKELEKTLDGIAEQIFHKVQSYEKTIDPSSSISSEKEKAFKVQIKSLKDLEVNNVYRVLVKRVHEYLYVVADFMNQRSSVSTPNITVPPGLQVVSAELMTLATTYGKLVNLNQVVYGPFYAPILREALDLPSTPSYSPMSSPQEHIRSPNAEKSKKKLELEAACANTASTDSVNED